MRHLLYCGVLAALLTLLPVLSAHAAPKPDPAPAVGVIDLDAVERDFTGSAKAIEYMRAFQEERTTTFDELKKGQYLASAEFKELQDLAGKPVKINKERISELQALSEKNGKEYEALVDKVRANLTEPERARLTELEQAQQYSPDNAKEYEALIAKGKEQLAEGDKARLTVMDGNQQQVIEAINALGERYRGEIQDERSRIIKLLNDMVEQAVAGVAKAQKLTIVLNKKAAANQATIQLVLWGGTDITETVTKALNVGFKPESFTEKKP